MAILDEKEKIISPEKEKISEDVLEKWFEKEKPLERRELAQEEKELKEKLMEEIQKTSITIQEKSQAGLTLINEAGLEHSDFSRSSLPNYFLN